MKKWAFAYSVREWFLSPKNWDEQYEPGDFREVITHFNMDTSDEKLAIKHLHDRAEEDDIKLEILKLEYKQEVEFPDVPRRIG